jgi:phage-related protein
MFEVVLTVRFYRTGSGASPVEKYLDGLDATEAMRVIAALRDVEANGLAAASVSFRQIDGKLWEIRPSQQRVFYVVVDGPEMVLLHAYKKQGQKAPRNEIEIARKRMRDVIGGSTR